MVGVLSLQFRLSIRVGHSQLFVLMRTITSAVLVVASGNVTDDRRRVDSSARIVIGDCALDGLLGQN